MNTRSYSKFLAGLGTSLILVSLLVNSAMAAIGGMTRVSVDSTGVQGNSDSDGATLSADGRYVAYQSLATNLVSGDTNGNWDVFVYGWQAGSTTHVSVNSSGEQGNNHSTSPSISTDGRYVVFKSDATNLVAGDTNGKTDVFVHDLQAGTTTRISVDSSGGEGNGYSQAAAISSNGRYVAFESTADNLVTGDTNGGQDIFVHDRQTGITTRISVDSSGGQGEGASFNPSISADGRYVAFDSYATNLVAGDSSYSIDVFVHDRQTGATTLVSINSSGVQGNISSSYPHISGDGRYVAFQSDATNLVAGDTNNNPDIFVHDLQTGTTTRVSVDSSGGEGNAGSYFPFISADGRYVAFSSGATNLVAGITNTFVHIFIHDRLTGDTSCVSLNSSGGQGNGSSYGPSISADGHSVVFGSYASNLVSGDTNASGDVFITPVSRFNLTVNQTGTGGGTVTSNPTGINCGPVCSYIFRNNIVVTLTATAATGSTFTGWNGDITGTTNPIAITVDGDKSIQANYTLNEYTLSVTSEHGTVSRSPDQATYHYGDVVQLTATTEAPGYAFANWSGGITGSSNPIEVTIHGNTAVTANYILNGRTLTITSEHGSVARLPDQAAYQDGDVVQLAATAATGYTFDHWSGAITGTENPTNVTISGDTLVIANYAMAEFTLTITSAHGTVTRSPDQLTYHQGDMVRLSATADADYTFSNWGGDATSTSNPLDITIQGNTHLTANYNLNTYSLTVTKSGSGIGTVTSNPPGINCGSDCSESYPAGTSVTLTASAAPLSFFTNWAGDGCSGAGDCNVTLHADTTVVADFVTYKIFLPVISKPIPPPAAFNKWEPINGATRQTNHPELHWTPSFGALDYEYCIDTIDNSACDTSWIPYGGYGEGFTLRGLNSSTTYFWQMRAINDGGATYADGENWFSFSTGKYPKSGLWMGEGAFPYFYVTPDQTIVREFSIYVILEGCGEGWISRTIPDGDAGINDLHLVKSFSFDGPFYARGYFQSTSETTADGFVGLNNYIACGLSYSGSTRWIATWYDDSQPPSASSSQLESYFEKAVPGSTLTIIARPNKSLFVPTNADPIPR